MSEPFIGEIRMFAGTFAPRSWAFCDGQLLAVSQNDALFSLFGTIYGGDGRTTFGLPDCRGRSPVHAGTGPGLPQVRLGAKSGSNASGTVAATTSVSIDRGLGKTQQTWEALPVNAESLTPQLFVHFIVALFGIYPSRS
ncbi:phage tail protein [Alcanivorax sp. DG881]|uniref:phage tail protein n=1 Tax=Alcanivorax sp. DG881 TaxID=236097 RepID=UPI00017EB983|nr:tail fiber protein [Alcanivorax sp. DG881]EDX90172.1 Phage Tail Collar Domain family [Alcanivorax sp. DG881]